MADKIPWPRRDEPERHDAVRLIRKKEITRQLLLDEAGIRLVAVEGTDEIVAIWPRVWTRLVLVISVRFPVMDDIKPVTRLSFTVAGRVQQPFDDLFVCVRAGIMEEGLHQLWSGWQAGEVEGNAAYQRAAVSLWRRRP